jgi:hypothetical protein
MATKKKKTTTKKVTKTENNNIVLKLIGLVINLGGLFAYSIFNTLFALASVDVINDKTNKSLTDILDVVSKANIFESVILLGDVGLFEFINYVFYVTKKKDSLIGMLVVEAIAFVIGGVNLGFDYPLVYITLLPIITGLINYAILSKED